METNRQDTDPRADADILALLDRVQDSQSIVDSLMAMPLPGDDGSPASPEWDAAVLRRIEARLADTMRAILEAEPERKRA